jgi:histidyl-tRNA synthetase
MNNQIYKKIKGFRDIYGNEIYYWHLIENKFKNIFNTFGYEEVKLPILERIEVFKKGLGDTSDIVDKEMFAFTDKDNTCVVLRPEGTASVARFFIENGLYNDNLLHKFYYYGPMFRRENPQKGRFRQFYQLGVEAIGSSSPFLDAEIIKLFNKFFLSFNVNLNAHLEINSIGCQNCRIEYLKVLRQYLEGKHSKLCDNCNKRLLSNPLRILDCKNELCRNLLQDAPEINSYLCNDCNNHFVELKEYLSIFEVQYTVNPKLVRGLDYYIRTAFEMISDNSGLAAAIGAGGRYDGLIKNLGGPDVPGVGFAIGVDRFVSLLEKECEFPGELKCFIAYQKNDYIGKVISLLNELRENNIKTYTDFDGKSLKNQLKMANKYKVNYVLIIGSDELEGNYITVRDMNNGVQERIESKNLVLMLKNKFIDGGVNCLQ